MLSNIIISQWICEKIVISYIFGDLRCVAVVLFTTLSQVINLIWGCGTCHITSYSFYLSRTAAAPLHQSCLPLTSFTQHLAPLIFSLPFFTLMHRYHVHSFRFLFILSYSSTVSMPEFNFWLRITLPSARAPHQSVLNFSTTTRHSPDSSCASYDLRSSCTLRDLRLVIGSSLWNLAY